MHSLPILPVGEQDFEELRRKQAIYVDKTSFIYQLVYVLKTKFSFMSRPRRFGKSLLINTLKELFLGRKELFEGLFIYDKISWETYPVIHLDFSNLDFKGKGLINAINDRLDEIATNYQLSFHETTIGSKFKELMEKLHQATGRQVVILIDEYDKPITDVLEVGNNQKAHEHQDILRMFYAVVKGSSAHIRFFFMTGIARFAKVSLFSDLNHLTDISFSDHFHNLLGYTQEELTRYFELHLNAISKQHKISSKKLLSQIKYWYNGFSWNGKTQLYNPYSILRFFSEGKFMNFWFDSGTPKFLVQLLKKQFIYDVAPSTPVSPVATENLDLDRLSHLALLFQTGYLTVQKMDKYGNYFLVYPNKEVEQAMLQHILVEFSEEVNQPALATNLALSVETHDFDLMRQTINALFASIPYQLFDQHQEKYFHAILFLAFRLCGFHVQAEVSVSSGRVDAVMQYQNRVYVFEFKLNDTADNALKQIHEKGYYQSYLQQGKEIYLIGINFKNKQVAELKTEKIA